MITDSSSKIGYGIAYGTQWCYGQWPVSWQNYHINVLEMYPILAGVVTFSKAMTNSTIHIYTDNTTIMNIINRQSTKNKQIMHLVRQLVLSCLKYNIRFHAFYVHTNSNIADDLSRVKIKQFLQTNPHMEHTPVQIPRYILPDNITLPCNT